jgi:hypothetical protein
VTPTPDPKLVAKLPSVLASLGMQPLTGVSMVSPKQCYIAMLDGRVIGRVPHNTAHRLVDKLRILKIKGEKVFCFFTINTNRLVI